jgi:hypothetical protein
MNAGDQDADYDGHQMTGTQAGGEEDFSLSWDENGNMSEKPMTVAAEDNTVLTYNWDKKLRQGQGISHYWSEMPSRTTTKRRKDDCNFGIYLL